ncbi:cytochrome C1 heme lyase [Hysterangium stoloniferum]|nr:cytochrome C1 heme lyase [Hysterangium stoloniferum]
MGESPAEKCPVDHSSSSGWSNTTASKPPPSECSSSSISSSTPTDALGSLPTSRETSSIPRNSNENWVYPSEAQFFAAMARKQHNPHASDMKVIVPIHNAVNERAWAAVRSWEAGRGGDGCGGIKLVSFRGKPGNRSPKAWVKVLFGYTAPFDRHDWIIDRCGMRMRYVIDFYTGRPDPSAPHNPSFYIDARPALDSWEGIKMRIDRFWEQWSNKLFSNSATSLDSKGRPPGSTS